LEQGSQLAVLVPFLLGYAGECSIWSNSDQKLREFGLIQLVTVVKKYGTFNIAVKGRE